MKKVAEAIAVDTAMICRSCAQVSPTKGESAIGRAAVDTCGFLRTLDAHPAPSSPYDRQGTKAGWTALGRGRCPWGRRIAARASRIMKAIDRPPRR
jgi:hypothetical protein